VGTGRPLAHDEQREWLVLDRGDIVVACNFATTAQRIPLPAPCTLRLGSDTVQLSPDQIDLAGESAAVLSVSSHRFPPQITPGAHVATPAANSVDGGSE
jgi:hypothetical protein